MSSYIEAARANIRDVVRQIISLEKADVQFGMIAYRDHPPQDSTFVTKIFPFTKSSRDMEGYIASVSAQGGGDTPEAVTAALHDLTKLEFRDNATKVALLIADAPPHGLAGCSGDGFPNGSPDGLDPMAVCRNLATKGITLYTVGCEPSILPYKEFFETMSVITGGQYVGLGKASVLADVVVNSTREELNLEKLMLDAEKEVEAAGKDASEEDTAARIYRKVQEQNVMLMQQKGPGPSARAKAGAKCADLATWNSYNASAAPEPSAAAAAGPRAEMPSYTTSAVSMAQCERLAQKSRAKKGWFA